MSPQDTVDALDLHVTIAAFEVQFALYAAYANLADLVYVADFSAHSPPLITAADLEFFSI